MMSNKGITTIISSVLLISICTVGISGTNTYASSTTTKAAAAKAAAAKAAAAKAAAAKAAAASKGALVAESALLTTYKAHIDIFANAVSLYSAVASAYTSMLLTNFATKADFTSAETAVQNDLQSRKIDTSFRLDSILNRATEEMHAEIVASATARDQAMAKYEVATGAIASSALRSRAEAKVEAAIMSAGNNANTAIKIAEDAMAAKLQLSIAASDASHALDPVLAAANAATETARNELRACCGTAGVYASPETAIAATSNFNTAKAASDAIDFEYGLKLAATTGPVAEYLAAEFNANVVRLSNGAALADIWVHFFQAAYAAFSATSDAARDGIWTSYLNSGK